MTDTTRKAENEQNADIMISLLDDLSASAANDPDRLMLLDAMAEAWLDDLPACDADDV